MPLETGVTAYSPLDEACDLSAKPPSQQQVQNRALGFDFKGFVDIPENRLALVDIMEPSDAAFGDLTSSISNSIFRSTPETSR